MFAPCMLVLLMTGISDENYPKFTGRATGSVKGKCHTFIHPHKIQNVLKIATLLGHCVPDITNIILILGNTAVHYTLQPL
jgi:hypothetical protein